MNLYCLILKNEEIGINKQTRIIVLIPTLPFVALAIPAILVPINIAVEQEEENGNN
jgi:hypothetical protein